MASHRRRRYDPAKLRPSFSIPFLLFHLLAHLHFCLCSNTEALALMKFKERIERDPFGALMNWNPEGEGQEYLHCSWSGIECSDGKVVILNLKDLYLKGTLAPELGKLLHLKSLMLRNNSFSGDVPKEITELPELELLDLGHNNLSEPLPFMFHNPPELIITLKGKDSARPRRLLQFTPPNLDPFFQAAPPSPQASSQRISPPPPPGQTPPPPSSPAKDVPAQTPLPPPPPPPFPSVLKDKSKPANKLYITVGVLVGLFSISVAVIVLLLFRNHKVSIKPWATGISGQLQASLITAVPKLKLSELQAACEDFSNIIGSFSDGTIYKGTLSSGAEISVVSLAVGSREDWSSNLETQFKEKIDTLSKVNHKNFLNLVGYCQEDEPFSRMMVFEYAPNGSLFEHLHAQHMDHLDWSTRLRIAMGIACCLEHMHSLNPDPILHTNLDSSSVYLSEDNAAKVSDFTFLNSISPSKEGSSSRNLLELPLLDPPGNVYCFASILFEILTGKIPDSDSLSLGSMPARELLNFVAIFPTNLAFEFVSTTSSCLNPYPSQRPTLREVAAKLKEITGIFPDRAMPRLSPSWWAELEITSTEGS
ncbi:PREDICTED: protein MALE DISCOVERER 1-like [Tarenaya hassleriana]|uniref:protein MALE DISCOVERER 1-like n=1 Tax=Tarenaya hassleriana TaxID=28532 RepID=UPI00053C9280|nr:PREDICTED: protein MALE DISCOVERER 1-like [Tarenaya hassleriana]